MYTNIYLDKFYLYAMSKTNFRELSIEVLIQFLNYVPLKVSNASLLVLSHLFRR